MESLTAGEQLYDTEFHAVHPVVYSALYSVYFVHQLIERQQRIHNSWRNYMQLLQFYKISKFLKYSDVEH